jgi:chemotaxis signal transduction protein
MAIFTSRRFENRQAHRATRQIIVFQIQQEWFALPIEFVHRVIPLGQVYGVPHGQGLSLTRYENREIPVIDIESRVFVNWSELQAASMSSTASEFEPYIPMPVEPEEDTHQASPPPAQRYLLITQTSQSDWVGIPLATQPALRRVPESAFTPPPASYLTNGNVRYVSALVMLDDKHPSLFLLNLHQVVRDVPMLPGS